MSQTIQIKRGTGSSVPSSLAEGELAINLDSGKLFYGSGSSVSSEFTVDKITAETYVISSSVTHMTTSFSSGSTAFGDSVDDAHTFTGNITASGNISASGNLYGQANINLANTSILDYSAHTSLRLGYNNDTTFIKIGRTGVTTGGILLDTNVTASGDISASGIVYAEDAIVQDLLTVGRIRSTGTDSQISLQGSLDGIANITASGDISASGDIYANYYYVNEQLAISNNGSELILGHHNTYPIRIGKSTNPVTIKGHITASGDISASGIITANSIVTSDIDLTSTAGQSLTITAGIYDNPVKIVGGDSKVYTTYSDNSTAGTNIIAIGALGDDSYFRNDEGSFKFYVANDATVGAEINQSGGLTLTGNITAPQYNATFNGVPRQLFAEVSTAMQWGDQNITSYRIGKAAGNSHLKMEGHITASGNISSSGIITAEGLLISDDATITDDLIVNGNIDLEGDLDVNGTTNLDAVDIDGNVQLTGTLIVGVDDAGHDVTLFGNTSGKRVKWDASQDQLKLYDNTKLVFGTGINNEADFDASIFWDTADLVIDSETDIKIVADGGSVDITGEITASGNISASGTVTGLTGSFNQLSVTSTGDTASPPLDGHLFRITDTANNNPDIDHFFVENDALTYGMRWHYDGGDNDLSLYRHNNSSTGDRVIKFNRGNDIVTMYGSLTGVLTLGGQTDTVLSINSDSDIIYTTDDDGDEAGQHIFKERTTTLLTLDETTAAFTVPITSDGLHTKLQPLTIKVLPSEFRNNPTSGRPNYIHDGVTNALSTRGHGSTDVFYAFVEIPPLHKVTHVEVHASANTSNAAVVYSFNYQTGASNAIASTTFNFNGGANAVTNIPSTTTQDLVIKCTPGSSTVYVYGATVTLALI